MSMLASPFTGRSALVAWEAVNCRRCDRAWDEDDGYRCPIQLALRCSCPGPIAPEIAARMGYIGPAGIRPRDGVWPCREAVCGGFLAPIRSHKPVEISR